jgi:uracil-DNA glycosylase family 4
MTIQRKHPLAECESCPLYGQKMAPTQFPKEGSDVLPIAFVSRSPGKYDVAAGRPFAGPSGKVLDHLLGRYKVTRDQIITTNVVLCQSDDPPTSAIKACRPRLEAEIADSKLVIAGGREATIALTRYSAVHSARPFIHRRTSNKGLSQRVIVTNNPALVIRESDAYPDMVEDFRRAFDPPPKPTFPQVEIINEASDGINILKRWIDVAPEILASDLEWRSTNNEPICAGFAARGERAVVFGLRAVSDARFRDALRRFYTSGRRFIWHNGKSDTKVLALAGLIPDSELHQVLTEDTYFMSMALDERPGYHTLEYLLSSRFGWPDYEPQSVKNFKRTGEFTGKTDAELRIAERDLYKYNGWDTAGTLQLYELLNPRLDQDNVRECYKRLIHAANRFRTVELNGFHYNVEESCNINEREAIPRLYELTEHEREITRHPLLNPNSSKQLQGILYTEWGCLTIFGIVEKRSFLHRLAKKSEKKSRPVAFLVIPNTKNS